MSQENNSKVRQFLGDVESFQLAHKPFATIYFPGRSASGILTPSTFENWFLHRTFHPVMTSFHINTTQNRISSGGVDTQDEFWFQSSSYNMTNWAQWFGEMLEFYHAHNSESAQVIVTDTDVTTGAAAGTLTCATGHSYKVIYAGSRNVTRVTGYELTYTPSGGTAALINKDNTTGVQAKVYGLLGATESDPNYSVPNGPLWLQAGDTLDITDTAYVGGDTVAHVFVFEDYTL